MVLAPVAAGLAIYIHKGGAVYTHIYRWCCIYIIQVVLAPVAAGLAINTFLPGLSRTVRRAAGGPKDPKYLPRNRAKFGAIRFSIERLTIGPV